MDRMGIFDCDRDGVRLLRCEMYFALCRGGHSGCLLTSSADSNFLFSLSIVLLFGIES